MDVCRLFIEIFLNEKQESQLKSYLETLKDGVLIF